MLDGSQGIYRNVWNRMEEVEQPLTGAVGREEACEVLRESRTDWDPGWRFCGVGHVVEKPTLLLGLRVLIRVEKSASDALPSPENTANYSVTSQRIRCSACLNAETPCPCWGTANAIGLFSYSKRDSFVCFSAEVLYCEFLISTISLNKMK